MSNNFENFLDRLTNAITNSKETNQLNPEINQEEIKEITNEEVPEIDGLKREIKDFNNEKAKLEEQLSSIEEKEEREKINSTISSITAEIEVRENKIKKLENKENK